MTSPVSAVEAIEKAMEGVTPGRWGQYHPSYAPEAEGAPFSAWDSSHDISAMMNGKHIKRVATFKHAVDAAYLDACSPDRMREVLALARQAEALVERLKQEARAHAMEARTANSTIYEIYQIVSGGKGEPGSWHGAEPVRAKLEALERENAELREALASPDWYWPEDDTSSDACADGPWQIAENHDTAPGEVFGYSRGGVIETRYFGYLDPAEDADSDDNFEVDEPTREAAEAKIAAELTRRARTLLKEEANAE